MAIVTQEIVWQNETEAKFHFVDHLGEDYYEVWSFPVGTDVTAFMNARALALEVELARREAEDAWALTEQDIDPSTALPAKHQTKADLYRRVLGLSMRETDAHRFLRGKDFFLTFENDPDTGNNKPQRAAYLGVPSVEYDQLDKRMGDVEGARAFLLDEKNQVWDDTPESWL